jgi:hypothetical protein
MENKFPEYIQVCCEASSLKAILKVTANLYGNEVTFVFTQNGFSFTGHRKEEGKTLKSEFLRSELYKYDYGTKNDNGTLPKHYIPEYAVTISAPEFCESAPLRTAAKKKTCRFYLEIGPDGLPVGGVLKIAMFDTNGSVPIPAVYVKKPLKISDAFQEYYAGASPNEVTQAEKFGEFMISGLGGKTTKAASISNLEFLLTSTGQVYYLAKDHNKPLVSSKPPSRTGSSKKTPKHYSDTESDSADTEEEAEPSTKDSTFRDNSRLGLDFTPLDLKYLKSQPVPTPVYSVTISKTECAHIKELTKHNPMAVVQTYLKDGAPLIFRHHLGCHGWATATYVNVEGEVSTPKTKQVPKNTKGPKRKTGT